MEKFELPKRLCSFDAEAALTSIDERLLRFSADWDGSYGALLLGASGCGKSLAAATAMRRLTLGEPRYWAAWVRADVMSRVLGLRDHAGDLARVKSAHLVVIDEMGYERFPEIVLEVIGDRYDRDLPTVVTTGLKPDAFLARYSDATLRKISDTGNGMAINCWADKAPEFPAPKPLDWIAARQKEKPWSGSAPVALDDALKG